MWQAQARFEMRKRDFVDGSIVLDFPPSFHATAPAIAPAVM